MAKSSFHKQLVEHFATLPKAQLSELLASTISSDKTLKKQWQARLLLTSGKPGDYKKLLTQALPKKELLGTPNLWRKVTIYFSDAEDLFALAFEQLDSDSSPLNLEQEFTWLMQAFARINLVIEAIDDSGGYRLGLVGDLSRRLIHCFHLLDWSIKKKVDWLVEHQFKYDVFPWIPEHFELDNELAEAFSAQLASDNRQLENVSMALLDKLKPNR